MPVTHTWVAAGTAWFASGVLRIGAACGQCSRGADVRCDRLGWRAFGGPRRGATVARALRRVRSQTDSRRSRPR